MDYCCSNYSFLGYNQHHSSYKYLYSSFRHIYNSINVVFDELIFLFSQTQLSHPSTNVIVSTTLSPNMHLP